MSVGKRVRDRRKELKLSVDDIAKKLGKNRATIYRYESDDIENMSIEVIASLAKVLKTDPGYLMGWKTSKEDLISSNEYDYFDTAISAGCPIEVDAITCDEVEKISLPDSVMGKWAGNKDIKIMRVNGDSMNNIMPHNSLIAVKKITIDELKDGDIVVYSNDYNYAVKRFIDDENRLIFRPDSKDKRFTDHIIPKDKINNLVIHGKVVLYIVELD